MKPLPPRTESEKDKQRKLIEQLTLTDWYCIKTHGNKYQSGFADLFIMSKRHGTRWIEVKKLPARFTQAQLDVFTKFASKNIGVWVLTGYDEYERRKLHGPANWYTFLNTSRGITLRDECKRIPKSGPEAAIQNGILMKLSQQCMCRAEDCPDHPLNNWFCLETYGSIYQSGLPDIYAVHRRFGQRWIECKRPTGYRFTPAQVDVFPHMAAFGVGIHILTGFDDGTLAKIHGPANWWEFMYR